MYVCGCDLKLQQVRNSLAAEATGNTNLFHGAPHRLILMVVGMVRRRRMRLPLLQVFRWSRICVVQVFLAAGTGQELPPVSFELGSARQGGALRRGGSTRRRVVVMGQGGGKSTRSTGGYRRNGDRRQLGRLLRRRSARFERVVQFTEGSRRGLIQGGSAWGHDRLLGDLPGGCYHFRVVDPGCVRDWR